MFQFKGDGPPRPLAASPGELLEAVTRKPYLLALVLVPVQAPLHLLGGPSVFQEALVLQTLQMSPFWVALLIPSDGLGNWGSEGDFRGHSWEVSVQGCKQPTASWVEGSWSPVARVRPPLL